MKKLIAALLTLCLLLTAVAIAEHTEWTCPQCGTVCKSVQNFCTKDGQSAPWVWTCSECGKEKNTEDTCKECGKPKQNVADESSLDQSKYQVWDTVKFGRYTQMLNGGVLPIQWQVLDIQDNRALLISKYGLEMRAYNSDEAETTWETCSLRTWLNSRFMQRAFTVDEQSMIVTTTVDNSQSQCNKAWKTNGGNDTLDKVFLLSYAEAKKYFMNKKEVLHGKVTKYVQGGSCHWNGGWWLRSPGQNQKHAAYVDYLGTLNDYNASRKQIETGHSSRDTYALVIRPVIWVDLSALIN